MIKTFFTLNFFKYFFSFSHLKAFFSFFYILFHHLFFTQSSLLFCFNVGWDKNFLIVFNFFQKIIIFLWNKLTFFLPFLKLFNILFEYLKQILQVFIDVFNNIISYIKSSLSYLTGQKVLNPSENWWSQLKEIASMIFRFTVGGIVIYFFKDVQTFLLNSFVKIGDLMLKIVLRILDISLYLLKILFFPFQKFIMILCFILNIIFQFIFISIYDEDKTALSLFMNKKKDIILKERENN